MTDVSTPAPLFTHLAELRRRLIIALLTVGIGFVIGWAIREPVFDFLMKPLAAVMEGDAGRRMIYNGLAEGFF
ncbi:MAG: twin-arginine translocase subunit TatC, partial [Pseudomonadota bacterium]|nr:twin-arginine translocase subunit TatC [Pseudomonadota bacterium]